MSRVLRGRWRGGIPAVGLTVVLVALLAVGVALAGYSGTVTDAGPEGYWRLGEASGTTAADASGNGHAGSYVGSPTLGLAGGVVWVRIGAGRLGSR
jgi:hypothetical protein